MNRLHKLLLALLAFLLLLIACQPLAPAVTPSPQGPAMPPSNTGDLLPRPGYDPIDVWRDKERFARTEVIVPEKAVNYPVLIVEHLELDWDVLKTYAAMQVPDGVEWIEHTGMSATMNTSTRKGRPHWYSIQSDLYETDFGQEAAGLGEGVLDARYSFHKRFEQPPSIKDDVLLYSEQEAAEILRSAVFEWGVPAGELDLHFTEEYHLTWGVMPDHPRFHYLGGMPKSQEDRFAYLVRFRHMLYDIPVFDQNFITRDNPGDPESSSTSFVGHSAEGIVTSSGLRSVELRFRRVVEVEQFDPPILPISDIIDVNYLIFSQVRSFTVSRIELMLAPTVYEGEDADIRGRLVPAWCFFDGRGEGAVIIDALTGEPIKPSKKECDYILGQKL